MIKIKKYKHSKELMILLAPYALNKEVHKELGYPIFSSINHTWYLLFKDEILIGFCSAINKKNNISFNHDFIDKNFRGKGYYKKLFNERYNDYKNEYIKVVATNKSKNIFINNNFKILKTTKNYTWLCNR